MTTWIKWQKNLLRTKNRAKKIFIQKNATEAVLDDFKFFIQFFKNEYVI